MANGNSSVNDTRVGSALIVAIVGLLIPAVLVMYLASRSETGWTADDAAAIIGLFTSVVGTLVGAFLGVQVGAAGKEKAEDNAAKAEDKAVKAQELADRALAALPSEEARAVFESSRR